MLTSNQALKARMTMDTNPTPQRLLRQSLIFYLTLLAGLWLIGIAGVYARAKMMHLPDFTTALWFSDGENPHADLRSFDQSVERFRLPDIEKPIVVYPAPMMSVYIVLYHLTQDPLTLFTAALLCAFLLAVLWFSAYLSRRCPPNRFLLSVTVIASSVLFYPLWFEVERSNMEGVVWVAVTLATISFAGRWYKTAALFVALSASMKIYPGILLLIFLKEKRYKELAVSLSLIVVFTVAGLWSLDHNLLSALQEVLTGLATLNSRFISGFLATLIGVDHSLFSPVKQVIRLLYPELARQNTQALNTKIAFASRIYSFTVLVCFAIAFFIWIRKLPLMNQLVVLLVLSVTLPPMSFEYTLLQVLPAFGIFLTCIVEATRQGLQIPRARMWALLGAFAFIAAPLSYVSGRHAGFGGQLKLVALAAIVIVVLKFPMSFIPGTHQREIT